MATSDYQVIVVGSGAGGGMMAYRLTQAGVNVLMLEAGRDYNPRTETAMFNLPADRGLRGENTPDHRFTFDARIGGSDIPGEPYTAEGVGFYWGRARMLGGRTIHWGRVTPRYGPDDFKSYTRTDREIDWPVSYEEMAPYYDRTEQIVGVFGPDEGEAVYNSPVSPNHIRQKPPAPRLPEMLFARACAGMGIKTHATQVAILTSPLADRQACFYATDCIRGCSIGAGFDSVIGCITPARRTGKLTVITDAMACEVVTDKTGGRAKGVKYVDKKNGERKVVHAKVVVLAASAMESCRLLLNSGNASAPNGLANSSGLVGRYLSDTLATGLSLQVPALENLPPHNEDGTSTPHLYAPWWLHGRDKERAGADFSGGYKMEMSAFGLSGRQGLPTLRTFKPLLGLSKGLYGVALKQHLRRYYGSVVGLTAFASASLNENCYMSIETGKTDRWGIPVPRFHWRWTDDDYRRIEHANKSLHQVAGHMGAVVIEDYFDRYREKGEILRAGGSTSHEVGGCRMGDDPASSVLNSYSCSWDVPNLYLADGAPFVTHSEKNPTLTIMAFALRAADNIIERLENNAV